MKIFGIFAKGFLNIFIVIVDIASFKSKERDNGSLRAQSTECKLKKDWLEVNNDKAFHAKFDNSLGLSACCVGTRHVTKLRRKYSLHTGITSDLDTVSKITRSNIRVIMPRKARSLSKRKTM